MWSPVMTLPFHPHTATISITVVGETNIQTLLYHELLQALNVGGAGIIVDVQTVGLVVDDVGIGTQRIEHRLAMFQELPLAQSKPKP